MPTGIHHFEDTRGSICDKSMQVLGFQRLWTTSVVLAFSLPALLGAKGSRTVFYVSPAGCDAWSGTLPIPSEEMTDGPFKTLDRARDTIRTLKQHGSLPDGGVTILIRGGIYHITRTLELTPEDSGSRRTPIVYQAFNDEEVRLVGGKEIRGFETVQDPRVLGRIDGSYQHEILQSDLRAQGIWEFGELTPRGFGEPICPAGLELFFDDRPMQLARWPNRGWTKIASVPAGKNSGKFRYEGDRPKRWTQADDIWLHGYWTWDWADSYVKVKSINTKAKQVTTHEPFGVYGYSPGKRYYALNILEELDEPGEWYLDRKTGILYFWPPKKLDDSKAFVSILREPLISMKNTSNIVLRGLTIEVVRGTAVEIIGGRHNTIDGCRLRNIGNLAINIEGGIMNGVVGCEICQAGDGGIHLAGGDRKTLTSANNYARSNDIHHYSRWVRTVRPAVMVSGVGNSVSHNLIHDGPQTAILFSGNDHLFEFNEVFNVCCETGDGGAFYTGRDWTCRGTVIRYNYFHDICSPYTGGAMAVYLDDAASGITVFGNVFHKASYAVVIGGGRDNLVKNNVFVDCGLAIHVDARGLDWAKKHIAKGGEWNMYEKLEAVDFDKSPYSQRYPALATILEDQPAAPKGNVISCNIHSGGEWLELTSKVPRNIITVEDNLITADPGFIDLANLNFQLKRDSPAYRLGFESIPMEKIGLTPDFCVKRTALPN